MLQYQIDRIEHQVAEDRAQSGVFLIGPLERCLLYTSDAADE